MASATVNQWAFRGRNDDGNETTATWKAALSTNWSQTVNENFRVRIGVSVSSGTFSPPGVYLQYNLNGAGWNNVTTTSSVVKGTDSTHMTDGAATTEQLAGPDSFVSGLYSETGQTGADSVAFLQETEYEFCCQILSSDVANGDTVQLRVTNLGTPISGYPAVPSITVVDPFGGAQHLPLLGVG